MTTSKSNKNSASKKSFTLKKAPGGSKVDGALFESNSSLGEDSLPHAALTANSNPAAPAESIGDESDDSISTDNLRDELDKITRENMGSTTSTFITSMNQSSSAALLTQQHRRNNNNTNRARIKKNSFPEGDETSDGGDASAVTIAHKNTGSAEDCSISSNSSLRRRRRNESTSLSPSRQGRGRLPHNSLLEVLAPPPIPRGSSQPPLLTRGNSTAHFLLPNHSDRPALQNRPSQNSLISDYKRPENLLETTEGGDNGEDPNEPSSWLRKFRLFCGSVVEAPSVQLLVIFLIVVNSIFMGIGTFDFVTENPKMTDVFEAIDRVFLVIFTVELGLQLSYRGIFLFADRWLVFDFVIVVLSWSLDSFQVIRAFRIFRAFRLVTRIGPLRELIMALGNVMPRIYAICLLLLLVFYIFAVLFTQLFSDLELEEPYFVDLPHSLFTCMELMTLEWSSIVRAVVKQLNWAWIPLLFFVQITGFIVFNLIVAVVCDAVSVVDQQIKAEDDAIRERNHGHGEASEEDDLFDEMAEETDSEKLRAAEQRIVQLTTQVEAMKASNGAMTVALAKLAEKLEIVHEEKKEDKRYNSPSLMATVEEMDKDDEEEEEEVEITFS